MIPPIRVVVVDDSPFVCQLIANYIGSSTDLQVVGKAFGGAQAIQLVKKLRPDVVTLDVEMPVKDGLETLDEIMRDCPLPVIMVSGLGGRAASVTLSAIEMGAVDFILKYSPGVDTDPSTLRKEVVDKVKAAARTRVLPASEPASPVEISRFTGRPPASSKVSGKVHSPQRPRQRSGRFAPLPGRVVVIGASTGGPVALRELLGEFPADFDAAIVVVQHMPPTFTGVLARQLDRQVALRVREAADGDLLEAGTVLVAPGGHHLLIGPGSRVILNQDPAIGGHRPSIDLTMQSVAKILGRRASGVVLTGMGDDGASGLAAIREASGATFAQDGASCVINGMPQRAIDRGVVDFVSNPVGIARRLVAACLLPRVLLGANPS